LVAPGDQPEITGQRRGSRDLTRAWGAEKIIDEGCCHPAGTCYTAAVC
jgi:hypothetical protein